MEPEGSLSCSQGPTTGPYPESEEFNPQLSIILTKIHFNIILQLTSRFS
jgi:hypothetical protein